MVEAFETPADGPYRAWIEPWAEQLEFPAGSAVELRAASAVEGRLTVEREADCMVVYAWPGSTLKVYVDGELIRSFDIPVPGVPPGMDVKGFLGVVLGQSTPTVPKKAPWWKLW